MKKTPSFILAFILWAVFWLPCLGISGTGNGVISQALPMGSATKNITRISHTPSAATVNAMGKALGANPSSTPKPQKNTVNRQPLSVPQAMTIGSRRANGTPRQIKIDRGSQRLPQSITPLTNAEALSRARNFLQSVKTTLRLQEPAKEMEFVDYHTDELQRGHVLFRQKYKGVPVWPAHLNVHLNSAGEVDVIDGAYIPTPRRLVIKPALSVTDAILKAREAVINGDNATVSIPELIVYAPGDQQPRLAWKMMLTISMAENWLVIVDAADARILDSYNTVKRANTVGSGIDLLNNQVPLAVWNDGQKNYLVDTSKSMFDAANSIPPTVNKIKGGIVVMDMTNHELPQNGDSFNVVTITSNSATSDWLADGVSLARNLSLVYDYYEQRFGWKSFDNKGSTIKGLVRLGKNFPNAFWTSAYNALFFGDLKPYAAALDIVGHEFTHGVTSSTCNLVYRDQPGALNEAFSDIFGEAVEAYATGSTDWIDGTVFNEASSRNLKDPASVVITGNSRYPATMSQFYGPNTGFLDQFKNRDNGGVHINMTIVSHCFYLLASGMQGAIGMIDAEKIFHRAQTIHLTQNGQFIDARLACITSAEELFGKNSTQAVKTAEAFDLVEITDNPSTPAPAPAPVINAADSAVFVNYSTAYWDYYLGRKEDALGGATYITNSPVKQARASVTGDGSTVFFVDSYNDACFQDTNFTVSENCLGVPYTISSVAMSADGVHYAFITLDFSGNPTNDILVYNLQTDTSQPYSLQTPAVEGEALNTVSFADSMVFSTDGKFLIYDAYNLMQQQDGVEFGSWSIYAMELATGHIYSILKPEPGFDIGYPSVGKIHPNLLTFDLVDKTTGTVSVMLMNLSSGQVKPLVQLTSTWAVPTFTGDDSAVVYSQPDDTVSTGFSLMRQAIDLSALQPLGTPTLFQSDADFGVVYRRGTFSAPTPDIAVSPTNLTFGNVAQQATKTMTLTLNNQGTADLRVKDVQLTGSNSFSVKGNWAGLLLPSGAGNSLQISFTPTDTLPATATINITSDDPDTAQLAVTFTGTGITPVTHAITATISGSGSVTPNGTVSVPDGNNQDFTFTPAADNHIIDVLVDNTSMGTPTNYTFNNVTSPHTLQITFGPDIIPQYTITISHTGNGSVLPGGSLIFDGGSNQTFTIMPQAGNHIVDLLVDNATIGAKSSFTFNALSSDHSLHAVFQADILSLKGDSNQNGHITLTDAIDTLKILSQLPVAHIDPDSAINGQGIITLNDAIYALRNNEIVKAVTYKINTSAGANGTLFPVGPIVISQGNNQQFIITANSGYHVADVFVDGNSTGAATAYLFSNVTANHTIDVTFAQDSTPPSNFQINAGSGPNGSINPAGIVSISANASKTFTFAPDTGFEVADIMINGISVGVKTDYTFSNIQKDHTISVTFKEVNPGNTVNDIDILLNEMAGGRYDPVALMDEFLDIAVRAVWIATGQTGSPTFTGTLTQVNSSINFTYQAQPTDKLVVHFSTGNNLDIKTSAANFNGYTNGTVEDFLASHNVDFTVVSNTGINIRLISNTWPTNGTDAVYNSTTSNWQRRLVGVYPDGTRLINLDVTDQGNLQHSDPSSSIVFSRQNSTLTGNASSSGNTITVNERFYGAFSHNSNSNQEMKQIILTNNSSATMAGITYNLLNYQVNWLMGGTLNQQAATPYLVIESEKWLATGQVTSNGQLYGNIGFSETPQYNTKGPYVILQRADGTTLNLFRPIK